VLQRRESSRDSNSAVKVLLEGSRRQSFPYVDARVTLRRLPGDHTGTTLSSPGLPGIVRLCHRPSGPKPIDTPQSKRKRHADSDLRERSSDY
jgi:hypothetical protein